MSKEERRIRTQLDADIEKTLEEELKDGLCRLALNLHKLYRNSTQMDEQSRPHVKGIAPSVETNNGAATVVKMTITDLRVEGGCSLQINKPKSKVKVQSLHNPFSQAPNTSSIRDISVHVDWKKTLRSGTCSVSTIGKKEATRGRRLPGTPKQNDKEHSSIRGNKPLLLKWKY